MYERAPRALTQASGSTASGVGPGTYNPRERNFRAESYAPFLSMAARESFLVVPDTLAAAPGPGHYSLGFTFDKTKGGGALNNKSDRFTPPSSKTPGPGAYAISKPSDWLRKTYPPPSSSSSSSLKANTRGVNRQKEEPKTTSRLSYYRQSTAPSIPMPSQTYGYEEDEDGTLRPQELPTRDSTMGPAYYDVSHDDTATTRKYKGVNFGNLRALRTQFKGREGPGPGDYDSHTEDHSLPVVRRRTSRSTPTISYLPRYHELITRVEQKKAVPGPGQYEIHSQFDQSPPQEDNEEEETANYITAPFGSRQQRFLTLKHASPACTTYEDPREAFDSSKRLTGMRRTPFGQTSARFRTNRQAREIPGPGAYNNSDVTSMAMGLTKKAMVAGIQKYPFGTTSVRTAPLIKKDEIHMPGPAHYQETAEENAPQEGRAAKAKSTPKLSHTFASTTKRLYSPPSIVTDIPPPGSYAVSDSYCKSQGKAELQRGLVSSAFLSSAQRFAPPRDVLLEEPDAFNPGPGEYDPVGSTTFAGKGKLGLICCRDDRFKPIKNTIPGPGAYEMSKSQRDTLLQGTFNMTLTNPLSSEQDNLEAATKKQAFVLGV